MAEQRSSKRLADLLTEVEWNTLADVDTAGLAVEGVVIWHPAADTPAPGTLVLVVGSVGPARDQLVGDLKAWRHVSWAMCGWSTEETEALVSDEVDPISLISTADTLDATRIIQSLALIPSDEAEVRRLTALQRSLSQALQSPDPIDDLLRRLQKTLNAVAAIIEPNGRVQASTGALPLRAMLDQIQMTDAGSQRLAIEGWSGQAEHLRNSETAEQPAGGWLVVAARRDAFPSPLDSAAIHIAAALVDAARQMRLAALKQQYAIQAAIFDEALALRPRPDSPELASRLTAVGIDFSAPLRVMVATVSSDRRPMTRHSAKIRQERVKIALENADIPYLSTARESSTIYLVQADAIAVQRLLRVNRKDMDQLIFGIGRPVRRVGEVSDSHADALLAIRSIQAGRHREMSMAFEQFDFATRVFTSVGLDSMAVASREFLAPLLEREPLLEALRLYFEHSQNTNAAAAALGIHHNTLRYRLAKLEELLQVSLNDPSAIASLFLAVTSLDLVDLQQDHSPSVTITAEPTIGVTSAHLGSAVQRPRPFGATTPD